MEIFHIGGKSGKLAAVFSPAQGRSKRTGVLICNPLGHEYIRFHKALAVLAKELSQSGFNTFRFDYYGSGDSYGEDLELNMETSNNDLRLVIEEMLDGCEIDNICLIGVRYGTIPCFNTLDHPDVKSAVLWNPVLSGEGYLGELEHNHKEFISGSFAVCKNDYGFESLGFLYSPELVKGLKEFSMVSSEAVPLEKLLIIADDEFLQMNALERYSCFSKTGITLLTNSVPKFWHKQKGETDKSIVPFPEIKQIKKWLNGIQ